MLPEVVCCCLYKLVTIVLSWYSTPLYKIIGHSVRSYRYQHKWKALKCKPSAHITLPWMYCLGHIVVVFVCLYVNNKYHNWHSRPRHGIQCVWKVSSLELIQFLSYTEQQQQQRQRQQQEYIWKWTLWNKTALQGVIILPHIFFLQRAQCLRMTIDLAEKSEGGTWYISSHEPTSTYIDTILTLFYSWEILLIQRRQFQEVKQCRPFHIAPPCTTLGASKAVTLLKVAQTPHACIYRCLWPVGRCKYFGLLLAVCLCSQPLMQRSVHQLSIVAMLRRPRNSMKAIGGELKLTTIAFSCHNCEWKIFKENPRVKI